MEPSITRTTRRVTHPDLGSLHVETDGFSYSGRRITVDVLTEETTEGSSVWYHVAVSGPEVKKDGTPSERRNQRHWWTGEDIPAEIREHLVGREALAAWRP